MSDPSSLLRQPVRAAASGLIGPIGLIGLAVAGVTLAATRCRRVTVRGRSMVPALWPEDRVVVVASRRLRVGQLVAVPDPRQPARILIKRVASIDGPGGSVTVLGDNCDASTDSRHFGPVRRDTVVGRVIYRYAPAERAGRIRSL